METNTQDTRKPIPSLMTLEWTKEKDSKVQDFKLVNINGNHGVFLQMSLMRIKITQLK